MPYFNFHVALQSTITSTLRLDIPTEHFSVLDTQNLQINNSKLHRMHGCTGLQVFKL